MFGCWAPNNGWYSLSLPWEAYKYIKGQKEWKKMEEDGDEMLQISGSLQLVMP